MRYIFLVVLLLIGVDVCAAAKAGAGGGSGSSSDEDTRGRSVEGSRSSGASSPLSVHSLGGEKMPEEVKSQADTNILEVLTLMNSLSGAAPRQFAETVVLIRQKIQALPDYTPDADLDKMPSDEIKYTGPVLEGFWKRPMAYWHAMFLLAKQKYDEVAATLKDDVIGEAMRFVDVPMTIWEGQDLRHALGSHIFMPDDFIVHGMAPLYYCYNMRVQYALAATASYGDPLALNYLTKILSSIISTRRDVPIMINEKSYTTEYLLDFMEGRVRETYEKSKDSRDAYANTTALYFLNASDYERFVSGYVSPIGAAKNEDSVATITNTMDPRVLFNFAYWARNKAAYSVPVAKIDELAKGPSKYASLQTVLSSTLKRLQKHYNPYEDLNARMINEETKVDDFIKAGPQFYPKLEERSKPMLGDFRKALGESTHVYMTMIFADYLELANILPRPEIL